MKRGITLAALAATASVLVMVVITGWSVGHASGYNSVSAGNQAGTTTLKPHMYLVIHQGEQLQNEPLGPAYMPSDFSLPANTDVTVTITNFDDATPLPDNAVQYASASGIDNNSFQVAPMDPANPNAKADATTMTKIDPANVSHTFTIAALNLNVPISNTSITTFSFHTPVPGTVEWRCMDPCGTGAIGWNGAMQTEGYMEGHVTFA